MRTSADKKSEDGFRHHVIKRKIPTPIAATNIPIRTLHLSKSFIRTAKRENVDTIKLAEWILNSMDEDLIQESAKFFKKSLKRNLER